MHQDYSINLTRVETKKWLCIYFFMRLVRKISLDAIGINKTFFLSKYIWFKFSVKMT
jgi:hypothetical protein